MTSLPIGALKKFLSSAQTNFRGRNFKSLILNASMIMRGSFSIVKAMLDEFSASKILMLGSDYKKQLLEFIDPDNLEQRFGGNVPDKTSNYFPPDFSQQGQTMINIGSYLATLKGATTNLAQDEIK